jgi:hypothetical protein
MHNFMAFLEPSLSFCNVCNSDKKTYVVYDYYDQLYGHWCKECWMKKVQKDLKIGNILSSYCGSDLPPPVDKTGF